MNIDFSVLIPCYNRARHIGHVIQHVLDQTEPAAEIILVDDASTDNSVSVIEAFPVTLIRHGVNQGPAAARNTALKAATGNIVLYIDADAYAVSNLIQELRIAYTQQAADPALAGIGGQGIEVQVKSLYDRWRQIHSPQTFGSQPRNNVPFLYGLCSSYKRDVLNSIGGWDTYFRINAGEDADVGYRLQKAGYALFYIPTAKVHHQHTDDYASLKKVQYNWYYWSFIAKYRNRIHPMSLFYGTFRRMLFDTARDMLIHRDIKLANLTMEISLVKLRALNDAWHFCRQPGE